MNFILEDKRKYYKNICFKKKDIESDRVGEYYPI